MVVPDSIVSSFVFLFDVMVVPDSIVSSFVFLFEERASPAIASADAYVTLYPYALHDAREHDAYVKSTCA